MAQFSPTAISILEKRYLLRNEKKEIIETPDDMLKRVAKCAASAEITEDLKAAWEDRFFKAMDELKFLPNSPALFNSGTANQMLFACFVLNPEDNMDSIADTQKNIIKIFKMGGGMGCSFSALRSSKAGIKTTGGTSSGPVSFMKGYDAWADVVKQAGRRRGGILGALRVDHPDIEEFLTAKNDGISLPNFNLSVCITDKFMEALAEDDDYFLVEPHNKQKHKPKVKARKIWDMLVDNAWKTGDPGILFIDTINKYNPTPKYGSIETANLCGEVPMQNGGSCILGSINLSLLYDEENNSFKFDEFKSLIEIGVRFLDNLIDVNDYPLPLIEEVAKRDRRIGLGVMGFADLLIKMGIAYASKEALKFADKLFKCLGDTAIKSSEKLAEERGAFPSFDNSVFVGEKIRRNATTTSIAPTGSISMLANCSSSLEPLFSTITTKTVMDGKDFVLINDNLQKYIIDNKISKKLVDRFTSSGDIEDLGLPNDIKQIYLGANDIPYETHVRMQAIAQSHVELSISKSINFVNSATREDVSNALLLAYKLGCKGITIYRDGSKTTQVLSKGTDKVIGGAVGVQGTISKDHKFERPDELIGKTYKVRLGDCGNLMVTANAAVETPNVPVEVITTIGKAGECQNTFLEYIGRLISIALQHGVPVEEIIKHGKNIHCPKITIKKGGIITSCPDACAKMIEQFVNTQVEIKRNPFDPALRCHNSGCDGKMVPSGGGCMVCNKCGTSSCGG